MSISDLLTATKRIWLYDCPSLNAVDGGYRFPICVLFYFVFFAAAALAFAAFFLLLLIMTMARNVPTTADPRRVRMTGILIAQTRGGNRL